MPGPRAATLLALFVLGGCGDNPQDHAPAAPTRPDSVTPITLTLNLDGKPYTVQATRRPFGYSNEDMRIPAVEKRRDQDVKSGALRRNADFDVEGALAFANEMGAVYFDGDRYAGRVRCLYAQGYPQPTCFFHVTNRTDSVEGLYEFSLQDHMPAIVSAARAELTRAPAAPET